MAWILGNLAFPIVDLAIKPIVRNQLNHKEQQLIEGCLRNDRTAQQQLYQTYYQHTPMLVHLKVTRTEVLTKNREAS